MTTPNLSISYHFGTTPSLSSLSSPMDWFSWLSRTSLEPSLIYEYGLTFARNELLFEDATYFNHEFLQSMGISIAKHRLEILKLAKKEQESATSIRPKKLSGVIKKCLKKCMSKLVFKEDAKDNNMLLQLPLPLTPDPNWYQQGKWRGPLVRKQGNEEVKELEKPMMRGRTIALSGPLDGRMHHEKMVSNNKELKLSGPLDGKLMKERLMYANRSPMITKPLDARFVTAAKSPRLSGPLDARIMAENSRSPRLTRNLDVRAENESPVMGYNSPYNKAKGDFDFDNDHAVWPSLFQDLKPT